MDECSKKEQVKIQYILNENGEIEEISKDLCVPVKNPAKYKIKNAFEVFVKIKDTENYWISNYGRCISLLKDGTFYLHKNDKTVSYIEVERSIVRYFLLKSGEISKRKGIVEDIFRPGYPKEECEKIFKEMQKDKTHSYKLIETNLSKTISTKILMARMFLKQYPGRCDVWHKDGNILNNWYKNLLMVSHEDYKKLMKGTVTWQELNLEQEYIEYENKASGKAYRIYHGIAKRCGDTKCDNTVSSCYDKVTLCQEWKDNPKAFVKWYLEHYYEVDGEEMDVDKDLFGSESKQYSPETCCILPKSLNSMLANCKKKKKGKSNTFPFGVKYNSKKNKYYATIFISEFQQNIKLSYWDTPEEAFEEYRAMKLARIRTKILEYKNQLPDYIYKRLLKVDIEMY